MKLSFEDLGFFGVFIAFNLYMINIVEGIIPKLFFLYWLVSVSACAVYILVKRDEGVHHG